MKRTNKTEQQKQTTRAGHARELRARTLLPLEVISDFRPLCLGLSRGAPRRNGFSDRPRTHPGKNSGQDAADAVTQGRSDVFGEWFDGLWRLVERLPSQAPGEKLSSRADNIIVRTPASALRVIPGFFRLARRGLHSIRDPDPDPERVSAETA